MYCLLGWRREVQAIQWVPAGSSLREVFIADLAVSELAGVEPTAVSDAGDGPFGNDQAGSNRATESRDGGAGEGRGDEPTQYRPVALEIAFAIL
jgi:hypothetical protein